MKKTLLVIFSFMFLFVPSLVFAVSADDEEVNVKKYETQGLTEILKEEEIELSVADYKETDDQVTIYLFRGSGCGYCHNFLEFANSILEEYGTKFKVVGFEVWGNQDNSTLLQKVSAFLGSEAGGVPYIIIGDQVFPGYASDYDDGIKAAIDELYNSEERYDVFEEYNKAIKEAKKAAKGNTGAIIGWNAVITLLAVLAVVLYVKKQNKVLLDHIDDLRKVDTTKVVEKKKTNAKKKK